MNTGPALLILAAGMSTRYGSLKQLQSFGPSGETIMEYSIYDAVQAGFKKVVFIIRKAIETEFKQAMQHKFSDQIAVDFVMQELDLLPAGYAQPEERQKPWGTAHAVWVAASKIKEPFAVLNGDDFYGYGSFKLMADFLQREATATQFALTGFVLENTLSEHGAVSRGLCRINDNGYLESVTELTHISRTEKGIVAAGTTAEPEQILAGQKIVSMNLMGFTPAIFPHLEVYLKEFLNQNSHLPKAELYLPEVVNKLVKNRQAEVKVLRSPEKWFGVTYPEDKPGVVAQLNKLVADGAYPANLWQADLNA